MEASAPLNPSLQALTPQACDNCRYNHISPAAKVTAVALASLAILAGTISLFAAAVNPLFLISAVVLYIGATIALLSVSGDGSVVHYCDAHRPEVVIPRRQFVFYNPVTWFDGAYYSRAYRRPHRVLHPYTPPVRMPAPAPGVTGIGHRAPVGGHIAQRVIPAAVPAPRPVAMPPPSFIPTGLGQRAPVGHSGIRSGGLLRSEVPPAVVERAPSQRVVRTQVAPGRPGGLGLGGQMGTRPTGGHPMPRPQAPVGTQANRQAAGGNRPPASDGGRAQVGRR